MFSLKENDVPWEEHAIWFPKCNYLLLKKSREYVDQINNRKSTEMASTSSSPTTTASTETVNKPEEVAPTTAAAAATSQKSSEVSSETNTKDEDSNSATLCKICYSKEIGVVFLPCGHVVACVDCAPALSQCAVCRKPLEATFRAFLS